MGIKIYCAWRSKEGVPLFEIVRWTKPRILKKVQVLLREYIELERDVVERKTGKRPLPMEASYNLGKKYAEQYLKIENDAYDFRTEYSVHENDGRFYLIPYGGYLTIKVIRAVLEECPLLEEFAYWNNSDQPDSLTNKEWDRREIAWRPILEREEWSNVVTVDIVPVNCFYEVSPALEMMLEERGDKNSSRH